METQLQSRCETEEGLEEEAREQQANLQVLQDELSRVEESLSQEVEEGGRKGGKRGGKGDGVEEYGI